MLTVSVATITYNHAPYIRQTIESVLAQEADFPFEFLISDDCSTDNTLEIIKEYQERYPGKIRLIPRSKNLGMIKNFIETITACQGKYIAYLEGDDYWISSHKLQAQVDLLEKHPEYALSFHTVNVLDETQPTLSGEPNGVMRPSTVKSFYTIEDIVQYNFISACSVMFRNHLFGSFPSWFYSLRQADWPLHVLNAQHGLIGFIDEAMAVYRIHEGSVWSTTALAQRMLSMLQVYDILNAHLEYRYNSLIQDMKAKYYYEAAKAYLDSGDKAHARQYGIKAFPRLLSSHRKVPLKKSLKLLSDMLF